MNNEYIIVNKTKVLEEIEELKASLNYIPESYIPKHLAQIYAYEQVLLRSTPLIPEVEKAMNAAREIQDDSAHDTFTAEDISGCTEVCTYGWRYKTTNKDYISKLKLDI